MHCTHCHTIKEKGHKCAPDTLEKGWVCSGLCTYRKCSTTKKLIADKAKKQKKASSFVVNLTEDWNKVKSVAQEKGLTGGKLATFLTERARNLVHLVESDDDSDEEEQNDEEEQSFGIEERLECIEVKLDKVLQCLGKINQRKDKKRKLK